MQQTPLGAERVLFVHAHPDDESLSTGGTIATLVDRGAQVTVLTCTRGELGNVVPVDLGYLQGADQLGEHRSAELADALRVLGVRDHRYLGASNARAAGLPPRRYRDSGRASGASARAQARDANSDESFVAASLGEAAADIATVIDQVKPDVVISYAADRGQAHPDHLRAHDAASRAAEVMRVPFWQIETRPAAGQLAVDVSPVLGRKLEAISAHRSQLTVHGASPTFASGPSSPIESVERYRLVSGEQPGLAHWRDAGLGAHLIVWVLSLVVGAAIGAIATVNHQYVVHLGSFAFPIGIAATLLIVAALLGGARIVFPGRIVTLLATIGVVGVIGLLSLKSGGGSVLVPANTAGYLLTYGPALIAVVVLVWPEAGTFSRDKIGSRPEPKGKHPL